MSLPVPLTVQLRTARGSRHVTADARDLVLRWTDPGGYASAQVPLHPRVSIESGGRFLPVLSFAR